VVNLRMKPIRDLNAGDKIFARHEIKLDRVRNWKYAGECPKRFSPLPANSVLEIFEVNKSMGSAWVKAYIPYTHNSMYLKIAGDELPMNFYL
jgi:hypothetical protein